ncbi:MAG: hypothetical protein O0X49_05395, partial [Methanocorpusculum sp.]|nr:hypothetical protein [Methanocorpusculum sp.]
SQAAPARTQPVNRRISKRKHQKKSNITMDTITLILIIGLTANGLAFAALILAPPLYAWADRWLDRTHHSTAHENRD